MFIMKKRLLVFTLVTAMLAALTGCGGTSVKLGEYKGIALKKVTEEEYQSELSSLLTNNAKMEESEEPAEKGDTVNINYAGYLDGVAFEGGTDDSEAGTDLVLGSNRFIAGFEDGLIGATKGQELDLNLTFPDPYENNPDLAGKAVVFKVTVNKVTKSVVPELNDDTASKLGYASVEALEEQLREDLNQRTFQNQIGEHLMSVCEVKNIPQKDIDKASDEWYNTYYNYITALANAYGADFNTMLYYYTGLQSTDELKNFANEYAENSVKYQAIIKKIAKVEKIAVTDEEYNKRAGDYAKNYNYEDFDKFVEDYGADTIKDAITMDMVIEFIVKNAQIF